MLTLDKDRHVQIPEDLCRRHGWEPGQKLEAVDSASGIVIRPVEPPTPIDPEAVRMAVDRLRDGFVYTGPRIPVEKLSIGGENGLTYEDVYPTGEYPDTE